MQYAPYFCEENVWHLAADPALPSERCVVVVTGVQGVAMWEQRAASGCDPIVWDYHVFLVARGSDRGGRPGARGGSWEVWDLDTTLGLPVPAAVYVARSFRPVADSLAPRFRVIDAGEYRRIFSSDRSHMLNADGAPTRPFPSWPRIGAGRGNLARFIDMNDDFVGTRISLHEFVERFCGEADAKAHLEGSSH